MEVHLSCCTDVIWYFFTFSVHSVRLLDETRASLCKVQGNVKRPESEWFFNGQPGARANTRLYVTIPGEMTSRQELRLWRVIIIDLFMSVCSENPLYWERRGSVCAAHAGAPGSGRHMRDLHKHTQHSFNILRRSVKDFFFLACVQDVTNTPTGVRWARTEHRGIE